MGAGALGGKQSGDHFLSRDGLPARVPAAVLLSRCIAERDERAH